MQPRTLDPGQRSAVWVADAGSGASRLLLETGEILLEAPNWGHDGALYLNGAGRLWRLPLDGGRLTEVPVTGVPDLNNDHVLAPDGEHVSSTCEAGQETAGFELSTTVMVPTHCALASPSDTVSVAGCEPRPSDQLGSWERKSGEGPLSGS